MRPTPISFVFALFVAIGCLGFAVKRCDAQSGTEVKASKPIATGEALIITSKLLGEDRQLRVYLPTSYSGGGRQYPVIYTFDGEGTAQITADAVNFMTGYSASPQMPEVLVVGIVNVNRNRDMPIPEVYGKGGEATFLSFLADEIVPLIEGRYRTAPLRILLGHSQGGLFAHYAMTERPRGFPWIVSIDAPLAGFAGAKPIMDKSITLASRTAENNGRIVSIENLYGWRKDWKSLISKSAGKFSGTQFEIRDETHETMAFKAVYEGLKRLFGDYAPNLVRERRIYTLPELELRYRTLSDSYGYKVAIPLEVLLGSADQNLAIQHGAEALALAKHAFSVYGDTNDIDRRLREGEEMAKKGRDPRFEEWTALPPPSLGEIRPFIGSWERRSDAVWMIEFAVKEGAVSAQNTVIPPTFDAFHLDIMFVKVLSRQKIQWGERNGRGPGVTVFTATLSDDNTLEGTAEQFGFIMNRPPFKFIYKKRQGPSKNI